MKVFCNDKIDNIIDICDTNMAYTECTSIVREVYDNEYVVANLYVLGDNSGELLNIDYAVDSLANNINKDNIPSDVEIVTVLNRDVVTSMGYKEKHNINISNKSWTTLYITIDASYLGDKSNIKLILSTNSATTTIDIELVKNGHMILDKGACVNDHLARLQWLNSDLFINNKKSYIYDDITMNGDIIKLKGKDVELSHDGYIKNVMSYFDDNNYLTDTIQNTLLDGGMRLYIDDNIKYDDYKIEKVGANIIIHSVGEGDSVTVYNNCKVNYEGSFYYTIDVVAKNDTIVDIEQISLFSSSASKYMSGLGYAGGVFKPCNFKWNNNYQDSLYIGDINVGACIKWQGETDSLPFNKNMYKYNPLAIPENWNNSGKGGIDVLFERERARVNAYTGKVSMASGEKKTFRYSIHLTPFHAIDTHAHFSTRRYENNRAYNISAKKLFSLSEKNNNNSISLHNNGEIYKYINYPITNGNALADFAYMDKHVITNILYNIRDVSVNSKDIVPFNNIGDIIFKSDEANLQKNNNDDFKKRVGNDGFVVKKTDVDISCMMKPLSRYNNYYVEMVNWMAKECNIKGITLEDAIIDRTTIERVRKVLDRYRGNIETIFTNTYNNKMGNGNTLLNNIEILPFVDRIISNKGFNTKTLSPEEMLVEVSGIPYGVTSESIEIDVFLGMLFGIYNRAGYNQNSNKKLQKLLDRFDIKNSHMVGFWSKDAIKAKDENIKITYYVNDKKALICMYNFNNFPAVSAIDYSPLKIKGVMKSYPMSKFIINQKFNTNTTVVLYNKCGVFIEADLD